MVIKEIGDFFSDLFANDDIDRFYVRTSGGSIYNIIREEGEWYLLREGDKLKIIKFGIKPAIQVDKSNIKDIEGLRIVWIGGSSTSEVLKVKKGMASIKMIEKANEAKEEKLRYIITTNIAKDYEVHRQTTGVWQIRVARRWKNIISIDNKDPTKVRRLNVEKPPKRIKFFNDGTVELSISSVRKIN